MEKVLIYKEDFEDFRSWLGLNIESITWQGRFRDEFEEFWKLFFLDGLSLIQISARFEYGTTNTKIGPIISWFQWVRDKFISYIFIKKDISILELSAQLNIGVSELASTLRVFFVEVYPHYEDYFSETFQVGNKASQNIYIKYSDLKNKYNLEEIYRGSHEEEIMPALEVTLYDEWSIFLERMKKDLFHPEFNLSRIRKNASLKKQAVFIAEVLVLLAVGTGIFYVLKYGNQSFEKYLTEKISVYEPQFKWLDKNLTFKSNEPVEEKSFPLNVAAIDEVDDSASQLGETLVEEARFEAESEVVLTSMDSLPKDFEIAGLEQSEYEELRQRGYRDSRYGNTKVYRVMMKSVDAQRVRGSLNQLLEKYEVTQVDNVKPGLAVPGGFYYNLYVPRAKLKEFMAQVNEVDDTVIYESRTRTIRNPPGKNKVFIWVKKI
ncbi:hypothetical protein BIY24_01000 [Halobacteriovorax marinus]|uniref:hypothetical protein n=1 Tax=Halobacteriovorax marinus TaxID=97084 RepID=UPI000BC32135|nr:hypothetical protein [Halobacteriovorax marinus]ATH06569.1 hypothetical protein BIY24_01000 [Halobacteriovorax marinus]